MKIAGLQHCSFSDYPGKLAAVAFTPGCNFDCFYCHNRSLLAGPQPAYDVDDVLRTLRDRRGMLDALVVTGGEPTLQAGLGDFLARVREMGYAVKLDTNGSAPETVARLIARGLIDFVAMDLKAPSGRYEAIACSRVDRQAIERSIDLLLAGFVDYEFRTTLAPPLGVEDVARMAIRIRGARSYVLQQYRRPEGLGDEADADLPQPWPDEYIHTAGRVAREIIGVCTVRGAGAAPPETDAGDDAHEHVAHAG